MMVLPLHILTFKAEEQSAYNSHPLEVSAMMVAVGRTGMLRFVPWEKFTSMYIKTDQRVKELILSTWPSG